MTTRKTKRLKQLTEEDLREILPSNRQLIEDFLGYKRASVSASTMKVYESNLNIFMYWLGDKDFTEITVLDVSRFQNWCIDRGMSPARVKNLRSTISSISDFVELALYTVYPNFRNIVNRVPSPPLRPVREKTILEVEDVEELLSKLVSTGRTQHACLFAVAAASGMRKSELPQIKWEWVYGDNVRVADGMYVTPEIRTKGRGELGKPLKKYIIKEIADKYIELWMKEREEEGIESEYLFVRKMRGEVVPIAESTIDSWANTASRLVDKVVYPHAFRHFVSTWLSVNGVPTDIIKVFLGHEDSSTTEIYIDRDESEVLKGMLDFLE